MCCLSAFYIEDIERVLESDGSKFLERCKNLVRNNLWLPRWKVVPLDTQGLDFVEGRL